MRFFFDSTATGAAGTEFYATPSYLALTTVSEDPPGATYLYLTPGPIPNSMTIHACWENELDGWIPLLTDEVRAADWRRFLWATYPTVGYLMDNAQEGRYGAPGLDRVIDPDDMNPKWCISLSVGNVAPPDFVTQESAREFLRTPRLRDAYSSLLESSFTAAREVMTAKPSTASFTRLFGKEYLRSQKAALIWTSEWMPRISGLFG
ncbi:hypothetical protein [Agromyces sp. ZXT2-6]|uniref:hypothetical protein n=1 Tax=Agromyces sp. ZXT2-6 TaxID=3461153 RepID=UPI0040552F27